MCAASRQALNCRISSCAKYVLWLGVRTVLVWSLSRVHLKLVTPCLSYFSMDAAAALHRADQLNHTGRQFEESLARERETAQRERAGFVKEFSQADFDHLIQGWQVHPMHCLLISSFLLVLGAWACYVQAYFALQAPVFAAIQRLWSHMWHGLAKLQGAIGR